MRSNQYISAKTLDRIYFPSWANRGVWPYEAGIAFLLFWLSEGLRHNEGSETVLELLGGWNYIAALFCLLVGGILLVGLTLRFSSPYRTATIVLRVSGLFLASLTFFFIAWVLLKTFPYSLGGGAYLFLGWRSAVVGLRLAWDEKCAA
jgi:hypothetical protein